jgi:hypothetical protein
VKYLLGTLAFLLLASTACSSGSNSADTAAKTAAAQNDYCTSLNLLVTDLLSLQALGPTSSVGQIRDGVANIQADLNQISKDAKALQNAKVDQVTSSVQNLRNSTQNLSDSTSITSAMATLTPQITAVKQAVNQVQQSSCQ